MVERAAASLRSAATSPLGNMLLAEGVGTALLLSTVVGSGIMGERLAAGNAAVALLANSLATGAGLVALILAFGPVSGAHFNPVVTLSSAVRGETPWRRVPLYVAVQLAGAVVGVWLTHYIFELPLFQTSHHARTGVPQWASEALATAGLLLVIFGCSKARPAAVPFAVGAYITAAYWFTSSTSFANPAVTLARALTNTFVGIRPVDVGGFVAAQLAGAAVATAISRRLFAPAADIVSGGAVKTVLFACIHNAGRSQMAAAWFNALSDPAQARGVSAGTEPGSRVHPEVLEAMKEVGIDLSTARPQKLTLELAGGSDLLVTMGCGEACPAVPGLAREDWPLEDPKGKPVQRVREIRDDIRARVMRLAESLGCARKSSPR